MAHSKTQFGGPKGTTPGGEWLVALGGLMEEETDSQRNGRILCCCAKCLCGILLGSLPVDTCCEGGCDKRQPIFIYRDPVAKTLVNELGHILPPTTKVEPLTIASELEKLKKKYENGVSSSKMVRSDDQEQTPFDV